MKVRHGLVEPALYELATLDRAMSANVGLNFFESSSILSNLKVRDATKNR